MAIRKATVLRGLGLVAIAAVAGASLVGCSIGGGGIWGLVSRRKRIEIFPVGYLYYNKVDK